MSDTFTFYLFSALAIGASFLVIGQRNLMYSVLLLVASFAQLSGLYILLDAPFAAVTQMIVYAGAIMVLFLFVVMLLNAPQEDAAGWDRTHPFRQKGLGRWGALLAAVLVVEVGLMLSRASVREGVGSQAGGVVVSSVREIGRVIFTDYMFAFEATSILILVAMVGAYILARQEGQS